MCIVTLFSTSSAQLMETPSSNHVMAPCFAAYSTLGVLHSCVCCGSASNEAMKQPAGTTCCSQLKRSTPSDHQQLPNLCTFAKSGEYSSTAEVLLVGRVFIHYSGSPRVLVTRGNSSPHMRQRRSGRGVVVDVLEARWHTVPRQPSSRHCPRWLLHIGSSRHEAPAYDGAVTGR